MNHRQGRPKPYIGVSGVASPAAQAQLESMAKEAGVFDADRLLALGVKAVHKTQYLDIENRYGREWYPVGEAEFSSALRHSKPNPNTLAVAQTYLDKDHVADPDYRRRFLHNITSRGRPWLQALQFDLLPWHNDSQMLGFLEMIKSETELAIFLQCHKQAMDELGPRGIARRLGHYAVFVDYLLFDASHGTGSRLDTATLDGFLEEAYTSRQLEQTGLAVAGGLNATVVREDLPNLIAVYPDLSWDAEGQLHPANDAGKRPLEMKIVRDYLQASAEIISSD